MHIYMATDTTGTLFNYRGQAGPNDDPVSFKFRMEKQGLAVIIRSDNAPGTGKNIPRNLVEAN